MNLAIANLTDRNQPLLEKVSSMELSPGVKTLLLELIESRKSNGSRIDAFAVEASGDLVNIHITVKGINLGG